MVCAAGLDGGGNSGARTCMARKPESWARMSELTPNPSRLAHPAKSSICIHSLMPVFTQGAQAHSAPLTGTPCPPGNPTVQDNPNTIPITGRLAALEMQCAYQDKTGRTHPIDNTTNWY